MVDVELLRGELLKTILTINLRHLQSATLGKSLALRRRYRQTECLDFGARGALHLNVLMNTSNVPLQMRSMEHLRAVRAMLAHIIMNFFDVLCQTPRIELLRTERAIFAHISMNFFDVSCQVFERHFFLTARALFLDSRVDHLHVLRKLGRSYLLLALRALSCVAHVSLPNMAFNTC